MRQVNVYDIHWHYLRCYYVGAGWNPTMLTGDFIRVGSEFHKVMG